MFAKYNDFTFLESQSKVSRSKISSRRSILGWSKSLILSMIYLFYLMISWSGLLLQIQSNFEALLSNTSQQWQAPLIRAWTLQRPFRSTSVFSFPSILFNNLTQNQLIWMNQYCMNIELQHYHKPIEMNDYEERRQTARKTLLLQQTFPFQIEAPSHKGNAKRGGFRFRFFRKKSKLMNTKAYLSEEERIYSKVHDASFFLSNNMQNKNYLQKTWEKLTRDYPPYEPQNPVLLVWYIIVLVVLWFNIFEIPLAIFFGKQVYEDEFTVVWSRVVNYLSLVILLIDMFLKVNIAYYRHGVIVNNRRKILSNYMQLSFWIDILGILVLTIYVFSDNYYLVYLKLVFYVKCYDIWNYDTQIQKIIELNLTVLCFYKLFRIIIIFLIYSHWMACGFFAIDYHLYQTNQYYRTNHFLWLDYSAALPGIDMVATYTWSVWYAYAIYWALQTATTVGYGDVTPKNPEQVIYVIVNIIAMCVMFGYFINSVWEIIGDWNSKSEKYKKNMSILNRFLNNKVIPSLLKQKMRAYLDYLWRQDSIEEVEDLIIGKLTPSLKDELIISIKYPFFIKVRLFNLLSEIPVKTHGVENFGVIKKELAYSLKQERFSQDQLIFEKGDIDFRMFYLLDGKVRIGLENYHVKGFISTTQNFGQLEFITEQRRHATATVVKYCLTYYLEKAKFVQILKQYEIYYENYLKLRDQILIGQRLENINITCFNCYQNHCFIYCPETQLVVNKLKLKLPNHNLKITQQRGEYHRADIRRQVSYLKNKYKPREQIFERVYNYEAYKAAYNIKNVVMK